MRQPENADLYILMGRAQAQLKDWEGAEKSFKKALRLNPDSLDALLCAVRLEEATGNLEQAIAEYERLVAQDQDDVCESLILAALYDKNNEQSKAKTLYEAIIKKYPDSAVAANNLAFYYAERLPSPENLTRAASIITPALDKYPDETFIQDTMAWICFKRGEYQKAKEMLVEVGVRTENLPIVNYHMGMVLLKLGERENAKMYLEASLKSGEEFTGKEEAEKALERL